MRIESGPDGYGNARLVPVVSHNRLLASYEGARGGKTGFTFKARHCFVGEVDRGGIPLIVAVFNSPSRGTLWQDARTLLDYGFARYGLAPPPPVMPEPVLRMARRESAAMRVATVRVPAGQRGRATVQKNDNGNARAGRRPQTAKAQAAPGRPALAKTKATAGGRRHQPGKPVAVARVKGKPAAVAASKSSKPAVAKVAARVEPASSKPKSPKRRI